MHDEPTENFGFHEVDLGVDGITINGDIHLPNVAIGKGVEVAYLDLDRAGVVQASVTFTIYTNKLTISDDPFVQAEITRRDIDG